MYGTGVVFGERVVLLEHRGTRMPGSLLLPSRRTHPAPRSEPRRGRDPASADVWRPGRDDTVRGRAEHAVRPAAEQRRTDAAHALGMTLKVQADADVAVAERLSPPDTDEARYAEAALDVGAWRYKTQQCPPGPALAALLDQRPDDLKPRPGAGVVFGAEFDGIPGGAVPDDPCWANAVLTSVVARAKLIAHLQAEQYADVAELSGCYPGIHQFLTTELAAALHTTDAEAAGLLGAAEALRDRLPDTLRALTSGDIDNAKAMALVNGTAACDRQVAHAAEQQVLPGAREITATAVRRRTTRAVIAADPDGAAARHRHERNERHVYRHPENDGMARLGVYAPAQDIATIWEAITAVADAVRTRGDTRTLGQRRTDALVMICADIIAAGGWQALKLPDRGYGRPRINVTVPYTVLAGHRAPCDLAGHGPVAAEQALALIGNGELYRMICDPIDGSLLDYGRQRYKPPRHLAEFVRMRDGECPMPTCHHPATRGQLDHIVAAKPDPATGRPTHGTTSADNLAAPCHHHHLSKDAGRGFMLHRALDGTYTWTTPLGRRYTWRPEPLWHSDTDESPTTLCSGGDEATGKSAVRASPCSCVPGTGSTDGPPDIASSSAVIGDDGSGGDDRSGNDGSGDPDSFGDADILGDGSNGDGSNGDVSSGHGSIGDGVDIPLCDCPGACPCQYGPELDPDLRLEPLAINGDWADGFLPPSRGAESGAASTPVDAPEGIAAAGAGGAAGAGRAVEAGGAVAADRTDEPRAITGESTTSGTGPACDGRIDPSATTERAVPDGGATAEHAGDPPPF